MTQNKSANRFYLFVKNHGPVGGDALWLGSEGRYTTNLYEAVTYTEEQALVILRCSCLEVNLISASEVEKNARLAVDFNLALKLRKL